MPKLECAIVSTNTHASMILVYIKQFLILFGVYIYPPKNLHVKHPYFGCHGNLLCWGVCTVYTPNKKLKNYTPVLIVYKDVLQTHQYRHPAWWIQTTRKPFRYCCLSYLLHHLNPLKVLSQELVANRPSANNGKCLEGKDWTIKCFDCCV